MKTWSKIVLLIIDLILIGSIIAYILIQTDSPFQSPLPIGYICLALLLFCALCEFFIGGIGFGNKGLGQRIIICNIVFVLFIILWFSYRNFEDINSVFVKSNDIVVPILWGVYTISLLGAAFGIIYYTGKAYFITEKVPEKQSGKPTIFTDYLSDEDEAIVKSFDAVDILLSDNETIKENLKDLKFPNPKGISSNDSTSFVKYLQKLQDVPKAHPELGVMEQFILTVNANTHLEDFYDSLQENISNIHFGDSIKEVKDLLTNAKEASLDWVHTRNPQVTELLTDNITQCLKDDFHNRWTQLALHNKGSLASKLLYTGRKMTADAAKGWYETFVDTDSLSHIANELGDHVGNALTDIASDVPHDLGLDMWNPDYALDAHFPLTSSAITLFKAGKQTIAEDADVEKTLTNAGVKIASTTGGVAIGGIIGNFIFPGLGGLIGGAIGGALGRKLASNVNTAELKELQEKLQTQQKAYKEKTEKANQEIADYGKKTTKEIKAVATREYNHFTNLRKNTPVDKFEHHLLERAFCIVLRDHVLEYMNAKNDEVSFLINKIPSLKQIEQYPRESVKSLLSILSRISELINGAPYYNGQLIKGICAEYTIKSLVMHQQLLYLWQNKIIDDYKESINNIFEKSEECIQDYIQFVENEKSAVAEEERKTHDLIKQIKAEAKTLV